MYCRKCGAQLKEDALFCHQCGINVNLGKKREVKIPSISNKKTLIISIVIISLLFGTFVCIRGNVFYNIKNNWKCRSAIVQVNAGNFAKAMQIIENVETSRAKGIKSYLRFREKIEQKPFYNNYNLSLLHEYRKECSELLNNSEGFGDIIEQDLKAFKQNADLVITVFDMYEEYSGIDKLYDATNEYNRLHSSDESGNFPTYTIEEEREKIRQWKLDYEELTSLLDEMESEDIYLGDGVPRLQWLKTSVPEALVELSEIMDNLEKKYSTSTRLHATAEQHLSVTHPYGRSDEDKLFNELARTELWNLLVYRLERPAVICLQEYDIFDCALLSDKTIEIVGLAESAMYKLDFFDFYDVEIPTHITIKNKKYVVSSVGESAFMGDPLIKGIFLPSTITRIGPRAFSGTNKCDIIEFSTTSEILSLNALEDTNATVVCSEQVQKQLEDIFGYGTYSTDGGISENTYNRYW